MDLKYNKKGTRTLGVGGGAPGGSINDHLLLPTFSKIKVYIPQHGHQNQSQKKNENINRKPKN